MYKQNGAPSLSGLMHHPVSDIKRLGLTVEASPTASLEEMELPERQQRIMSDYEKYLERQAATAPNRPLIQLFDAAHGQEDGAEEPPCVICDL